MIYEIYTPQFPLNQFVESFIYYTNFNPAHSVDRFLPDGNINVVIDLTDYPKFIYDNHTLKEIQSCKNVWFSGIRNKFITIPSGRDSEMFIINFHKGKAYPFVEMPQNELTDCVVDGELVLTNEILNIRERLLGIKNIPQKFECVEQQLLKVFGKRMQLNPFVDFAVGEILRNPNIATIEKIAEKVGYSHKHLINIFKENVGLTPKSFLKVIRFQKAITEIEKSARANWTGIAFESGYFDQAHFINDFKNFSGFTPTQFLQLNNAYTNYIAVG
ncbi:MAG: helix-turn-helix domain-containing protein [Bacteroidetes bacterium]|nr:helix-turn-helix domain-containing protein [Bacteroidota bacterium]